MTGAARVALGPELPALFTPDDELAEDLLAAGAASVRSALAPAAASRPIASCIDSPIADINNAGSGGFAGAITAALFLKDFVEQTTGLGASRPLSPGTTKDRPGRPQGGEATALRALLALIERASAPVAATP